MILKNKKGFYDESLIEKLQSQVKLSVLFYDYLINLISLQ